MESRDHHKYSKKEYNNRKKEKYVHASKYLALVLRHKALDFGLTVEPNGFIKLSDIFALQQSQKYHFTEEMIKEIVASDEKGRYELVNRPPYYIRAVQGHSITEVTNEATLTPIKNIFQYPTVVHGTDSKAWGFIEKTGLNKMARNAIHFSIRYIGEGQVKSGMRKNCEIYIEVNAIQAYYNNIEFFISANNVVLSPGINGVIPAEYIKKVTNRDHNVIYSQKYSVFVYYTSNQIIIYDDDKVNKKIDNSNSTGEVDVINSVSEMLISSGLVKSPFVTVVDKGLEARYIKVIQEGIEKKIIKHPGAFVDYVLVPNNSNIIDLSNKGELTSKIMKKVNVNWEEYYKTNE